MSKPPTPKPAPPPPPRPPGLPGKGEETKIENPLYAPRFKLLKLVIANDLALVDCLCTLIQATEFDEASKALIGVFGACGEASHLLHWAIRKEVMCAEGPSTLFRGVSVATKLVAAYFKIHGTDYLKRVLRILLREVVQNGCRLEVDPEKIGIDDELKANQERLQFHCKVLLDSIFKKVDDCPYTLRRVFQVVQEETVKRFPDMRHKVVGGFFFLRFVCPAVVAPEGFGLSDIVPDPKARRSLILVSKILQNLSNQVEFGAKEEYMYIMNPFITGNMDAMAKFVDELANPSVPAKKMRIIPPKEPEDGESLNSLYNQIMLLNEKISKTWGGDPDPGKRMLYLKLQRALSEFPHKDKKKKVIDTVQHGVALKAVHKELKQRVEIAMRARASLTLTASEAQAALSQGAVDTPTPQQVPLPSGEDEVAQLIDAVAALKERLEEERKKARDLEEKVIAEEKKIEKEAEQRFQREYKSKVQEFKDMLDVLKNYKEQLLARPDLAAEFKNLRLLP